MKKLLSMILSIALLLALAVIPADAGYVYEHDKSGNLSFEIDFEEGSHTMYYHFYQGTVTWRVNKDFSYLYYPGGWGFPSVVANPLIGKGSDTNEDTVANNSVYTLKYGVSSNQSWSTSGGQVFNVETAEGPAPIILENGVTYRLSFDYLVESTYVAGEFKDSSANISTLSGTDSIKIGYGYHLKENETSSNKISSTFTGTIGTVFSYNKEKNTAGTYTGDNGKTRYLDNWYHVEYVFTPEGMNEFDYNAEGSIEAANGAPFLVLYHVFRYGSSVHLDNIQIAQEVNTNLNAMGGSFDTGEVVTVSGFGDDPIVIDQTPTRYGYEFNGWYEDGACTKPLSSKEFTAAMHNCSLYADWDNSKISFESYNTLSGLSNGDCFSVSTDKAVTGAKAMKYEYTSGTSGISDNTNRFGVKSLGNITSDKLFKVSFKYYLENGSGVTVYPVLADSDSNIKEYASNSLNLTGNGSWKTATLYFTAKQEEAAVYSNNLSLHVHANLNTSTVAYIDDVVVGESSGTYGKVTYNAGEGSIGGLTSAEVYLDYGASLYLDELVCEGKYIEGFYLDEGFSQPVTAKVFGDAVKDKTIYVKWTATDDLENYQYSDTLQNGFEYTSAFSNSGKYALRMTASSIEGFKNAVAGIKEAELGATYLISFKYNAPVNTQAVISAATVDTLDSRKVYVYSDYAVTLNGASNGWKTATVAYTENRATEGDSILTALCITPQTNTDAKIYIDDVTITKVDASQNFVIYDSLAFDGEVTAEVGETASVLTQKVLSQDGYTFDAWYTDSSLTTKFEATAFESNLKVYANMTENVAETEGDINGDGAINATDYAMLKQYILGVTKTVNSMADANGDGVVNAIDLAAMYNIINN